MRYLYFPSFIICTVILGGGVWSNPLDASEYQLRVSAGEIDRADTVVSFDLPEPARDATALFDDDGEPVPFQVAPDGTGLFWLEDLPAGETATFFLQASVEAAPDEKWIETVYDHRTDRLRMSIAGEPALFYQAEERPLPREGLDPRIKRGGFLHPVTSPSGRIVSESYPEAHSHHQGIWSPWASTRFEGRNPDFWNMHAGRGKVEFVAIDDYWSGPVAGGFQSRHEFIDLMPEEPKVALHETWTVQIYRVGENGSAYRLFDFEKLQKCATDEPLHLPEHHYGGLGFRGRDEWIGQDRTHFLTSTGITDREEGNGTRARWTYLGGEVDGERAGIVIMGHPANFRAPQPVRLHPREPFFCFAPSQLGDWAITPDEPYHVRYRFVTLDGEPNPEEIDRLWQDWAQPPSVEVTVVDDGE